MAKSNPSYNHTRTSPWQGAYHNGPAMIVCAKLLEELAEKAGPDKPKP